MEGKKSGLDRFLNWMETNIIILSVRRGLALAIPVLMIGSFGTVLRGFPSEAYQAFITTFCNGRISSLLDSIVSATFGILSLILIISVSYSFASETDKEHIIMYPICAFGSYLAFVSSNELANPLTIFNFSWLFTAICVTLVSCVLLRFLFRRCKNIIQKLYSEGADSFYQLAVSAIFPICFIVIGFALLNLLITSLGGSTDLQNIGNLLCRYLFSHLGNTLPGTIVFLVLVHIFWFFGLHGDNMLGMVTYLYFMPGAALNQHLAAAGQAPTEIFTNTFIDSFIYLGGTGATLCLLFAILVSSKKASNRHLAKISFLPAIFNINELMILGFPIILNPIMLIPFVLAPLVIMLFSTLVFSIGLVPLAVNTVSWAAPVVYSGIKTTGSLAGAVLQITNILIGTAVYIPFVKLSEKRQTDRLKKNIAALQEKVTEAERTGTSVTLMDGHSHLSSLASSLVQDLRYAMKQGVVELYYQPQIRNDGSILGAEALLRWKHPVLEDYVYPPLVIQLAKEDGLLDTLGLRIIEDAARTLAELSGQTKEPLKISVNISPCQLESPSFCDDVLNILSRYDFGTGQLAIEITEQVSLSASPIVSKRIERLRSAGLQFIMDDFGMGHSSMMYLKNNEFAYVKLDGSMVKELLKNSRISDIIISIKQLSRSLDFDIIAEYVEVQEQRDKLEELGCNIYQGWLYSKAIDREDFRKFLEDHGSLKDDKPDNE